MSSFLIFPHQGQKKRAFRRRNAQNSFSRSSSVAYRRSGAELGGVYTNPASHGEGRFVASKEWIDKLMANGQIATRYCDVNGNLTNDEYWNVNGSYCGIEGITSPDGRVFGKMAHAERRDNGVAVNIYGEQDLKIFESGVAYFK